MTAQQMADFEIEAGRVIARYMAIDPSGAHRIEQALFRRRVRIR
jgi:hypothetical protein